MDRSRMLGIYLDDHLALLAAGRALARRMLRRADPQLGDLLREARAALEEDAAEVRAVMDERGLRRSRLKPVAGALAERAGRLKLNGAVVRRSPLTPLVELDGLGLILEGVRARWAAVEAAGALAGADPGRRAERVAGLAERAETIRVRLAPEALAGGAGP